MNVDKLPYWVRLTPFCPLKRYFKIDHSSLDAVTYFTKLYVHLKKPVLRSLTQRAIQWCAQENRERAAFKAFLKSAPLAVQQATPADAYQTRAGRQRAYTLAALGVLPPGFGTDNARRAAHNARLQGAPENERPQLTVRSFTQGEYRRAALAADLAKLDARRAKLEAERATLDESRAKLETARTALAA